MKLKLFLLLFPTFCLLFCKRESEATRNYPEGIVIIDLETENDCSLPECSDGRIIRLMADNVEGQIYLDPNGDFAIRYSYPIDTRIELYFCNLPDEFKEEGLAVIFDGEIMDACGIRDPVVGGQKNYLVQLANIEKQ